MFHVLMSRLSCYIILSWLEYTGHRWLMHKTHHDRKPTVT